MPLLVDDGDGSLNQLCINAKNIVGLLRLLPERDLTGLDYGQC